jgi:ribonuclease G
MTTEILINSRSYEVRIALVESGYLTEFHLQRPTEKGLMGNLYLGRVVRVLPGMQAAFVDIGLERTGFLYVDDVFSGADDLRRDQLRSSQVNAETEHPDSSGAEHRQANLYHIEDLLKEGQEVLVQVSPSDLSDNVARQEPSIYSPDRPYRHIPEN